MNVREKASAPVAFVAHSFARTDATLVAATKRAVRSAGYSIVTGEAAEVLRVSEKVRQRIDGATLFVALLTRRFKIGDGRWSTSPWVIEEKAYSLGSDGTRPIILLVERGVAVPEETGGLNGDLEYIGFERERFDVARAKIREMMRRVLQAGSG